MNSPSEAQTHFRMVTTCIHEIGHTLGLEHCPDTACLMTDARGRASTRRTRGERGSAPRPSAGRRRGPIETAYGRAVVGEFLSPEFDRVGGAFRFEFREHEPLPEDH